MPDSAVLLFISLFTLAMASLWLPPKQKLARYIPWGLFVLALCVALVHGWLQPQGVVWVAALGVAVTQFKRFTGGWRQGVSLVGVVLLSLGLATHLLPGFSAIQFSTELAYRNLDKACVAFILLALLAPRILRLSEFYRALSSCWWLFVVAPLVIFPLAAGFGLIDGGPFVVPQNLWFWMWSNLLVTCVAEELFFRALIQRYLADRWREYQWGWLVALLLVSLLFGLVHFGGGWAFVLMATIAGFFYGMAYHLSGRIEIAILLHFFINLIYLLLRS